MHVMFLRMEILKLLSNKIVFTKSEFENLLSKNLLINSLNENLSKVKYFIKLMKKLGIEVNGNN